MKKLVLLFVLGTAFLLPAQITQPSGGGATINTTTNVIPKKTGASAFGDSALTDNGSTVSSSEAISAPSYTSTGGGADAFTARADTACVIGNWWFSSTATPNAFRYCDGDNVLRTVPLVVTDSPTTARAGTCLVDATGGAFSCWGQLSSSNMTVVGTQGSTNATASAPPFFTQTTTATTTPAGWKHAVHGIAIGSTLDFLHWSKIGTAATIKQFHGFSDQTIAVMAGSDVPAGNYVGIMGNTTGTYTGLTDTTHYVCVAKNGTTQTAVASTVLFDAGLHTFRHKEASGGGSWTFFIDGVDSGCGAITTNLPANDTLVGPMEAFEVTAGANFAMSEAKVFVKSAN